MVKELSSLTPRHSAAGLRYCFRPAPSVYPTLLRPRQLYDDQSESRNDHATRNAAPCLVPDRGQIAATSAASTYWEADSQRPLVGCLFDHCVFRFFVITSNYTVPPGIFYISAPGYGQLVQYGGSGRE